MEKTRIIAITVLIVGGGLALHVARAQQPGIKCTNRREFVRRSFDTPPIRGETK